METATQQTVKASELRIGNFIEAQGKIILVESIHEKGLNVYSTVEYGHTSVIEPDISLSEANPIPLTPEILEKCGFGQSESIHFHGQLRGENHKGVAVVVRYIKDFMIFPQYLHQLQNLYFALTGTELEIKL